MQDVCRGNILEAFDCRAFERNPPENYVQMTGHGRFQQGQTEHLTSDVPQTLRIML